MRKVTNKIADVEREFGLPVGRIHEFFFQGNEDATLVGCEPIVDFDNPIIVKEEFPCPQ